MDVAQFVAVARTVYVEVAQDEEFALVGAGGRKRKITHSRIAMLTGISRKDVRQIAERGALPPRRATTNRAVRVVTGWVDDERFHGPDGEPKPLPYGEKAAVNGFEELVRSYSADTTARVVLDELLHVGSIRLDDDGQVHLVEKAYVPTLSNEHMLELGCRDIADLASSVAYNMSRSAQAPSRLQLSAAYNDVPREGTDLFRSMLKKEAHDFLEQQNKVLSSLDRAVNPGVEGSGHYRVGVGIYYFEEPRDG